MHANLQMPSDNWITLKSLRLPANHWIAHRNGRRVSTFPSYYGNYAELLANPRIDAVYIATTTNAHYDNILQCLQAGKHVLCEKSLVRSAHEALTVCSLAKQKNLFLMEAMWTRFLPKTTTAKQWIREGRIGKVKLMQATIGWKADPVYNKRLFDPHSAVVLCMISAFIHSRCCLISWMKKYWIWMLLLQGILQV